ncbi:hypothetical protein ASG87_10010 [Frateuria sp. Soil773]|uniref:PepSY domain-containing protein n=1 Tax=Frateuria sp. Soil773 TaxID=1736407 RepID=UPI0006FF8B75|nr:PepSY domain-containing protein [Frateuria sp. Soil773]KRF01835.1 hypothetical protein ASG87_10010 [Frateuria sp. Soil773]
MILNNHGLLWLAALLLAASGAAAAAQAAMTLEQAIAKVQQETDGKVLSADSRRVGRRTEYAIKVLTPEGHVRVVRVAADAARPPASAESTKNPAGNGNKEKH